MKQSSIQRTDNLADPFDRIFVDRAEADWAFDLFRETVKRLRVRDPYDPRLAATLSERSGKLFLRLNFGSWLVAGIRGPGQTPERIDLALLAAEIAWDERFAAFSFERKESEPEVRTYELPLDVVRPLTSPLRQAYETTLDFIADKFQHWKKATHWKQHNPELVEAFFDPVRRERLFAEGLADFELLYERQFTAFEEELVLAEEGEGYGEQGEAKAEAEEKEERKMKSTLEDQLFSEKTFELLSGLHQDPTKDFYQAHKKEFKKYVEGPLKKLFRRVAQQLPTQITDVMETNKRVMGRILKNDYGQGGAWDFYWGAFYPKGGKRTENTQLMIWINHERIEYGFFIGVYGSNERDRFLKNTEMYQEKLIVLLQNEFEDDEIIFQGREQSVSGEPGLTFSEWLQHPEEGEIRVAKAKFFKEEVLSIPEQHLANEITEFFVNIFPLVLVGIEEDPIPAIQTYANQFFPTSQVSELSKQQLPVPQPPTPNPPYSLTELAADTGLDEAELSRWLRAIERKGQVILYGPPGTGKTFIAERLARHLTGESDGLVDLVQFHPAYAYEDFMQGLRPEPLPDGGLAYPLVKGRFLEFCAKATRREGVCVLIIDEINRANLARVFGELMFLLEYRAREIPLASGGPFQIPANVRLIGTMNTADRSIALVDHALRRRFAFLPLYPNFDILRRYHHQRQTGFAVEGLIRVLARLNQRIGDAHYAVGITFFLHESLAEEIEDIWRMEIEPYLEEYFFDRPDTVDEFRWEKVQRDILADSARG